MKSKHRRLPSLKTKRLILRPLSLTDFEAWAKTCRERLPQQNKFDKGPPPEEMLSKRHYLKWLKRTDKSAKLDLLYIFGIFDKKTSSYIGLVNFVVVSRLKYQFANLGYEISNQYWGKGFATESVKALVPFAMRALHLHRIEAGIEPDNRASIAVVKKAGLLKEGIRRKFFYNGKNWLDLVYYSTTAEDLGINSMRPVFKATFEDYF